MYLRVHDPPPHVQDPRPPTPKPPGRAWVVEWSVCWLQPPPPPTHTHLCNGHPLKHRILWQPSPRF